jgi:hypothetical protein
MPEAEAAIASMNEGELDGRRIRVNLANSKGLDTVPGWPDQQGYGGGGYQSGYDGDGYMYQSGYGPRDESSKITTNTGFDQKTPPTATQSLKLVRAEDAASEVGSVDSALDSVFSDSSGKSSVATEISIGPGYSAQQIEVGHKARFLATAIAGNNPEQSSTLSHDAHYSQPTNDGLEDKVDAGDEEGGDEQHIADYGDVIGEFTQVKDFLQQSEAFQTFCFQLKEHVN